MLCVCVCVRSGTKWLSITGGTVTTPGCGGIDLPGYSSQAAFFTSTGSRSIETQVLDLRLAQYVHDSVTF